MNLFSKLFKRNKVVTNSLDLVNINNFIVFPDKSFYEKKENKELYKEFNNYYKEILNTRKSVTSKDFNIEEVDINLYTDIIKKLLFELDYTLDLVNNSEERNSVNIKIIYLKLKHYQNKINSYKNELFIKLKVLNELYKKHIFSKNKREAIKSEITNIEFKIVICQSNFHALNLEINNYSSIINYTSLKEVDEKKYLNSRNKILKKYMSLFNLDYKSDNSLVSIVANELILESYLFTSEIDLRQEFSDGIRENYNDKEKALKTLELINNIIDKYKAISKFTGKENEDFIKLVFKNKYDLIKYNYNENPVLFKDVTFYKEELEYYNDCLLKEVNTFINDRTIFKNYKDAFSYTMTYGKYQNISTSVRNLIKNNIYYDENKMILGLILSLNNPLMIKNYFQNFKVSIDYLRKSGVKLFESFYTWEDEISIESLIQLCASKMDKSFVLNNNGINVSLKKTLTSLFEIYKTLNIFGSDYRMDLYEGIINLEFNIFSIDRFGSRALNEFKSHLKIVCETIDDRKYYKLNLPSTLKLLNTNVFDEIEDACLTDIYVNKNLETLLVGKGNYCFIGLSSSLKKLTLEEKVDTLQISNYFNENNYSKEKLYQLLMGVFRKDKNNKLECLLNTLVFKFDDFEDIRIDFNKFISNRVHSSRDVIYNIFDYIDKYFIKKLNEYEKYAYAFDLKLIYPNDFILDKVRYIRKNLDNLEALGKLDENILKGDLYNLYNKYISHKFYLSKELINEFDNAITRCDYAVKQDYNMREIYKEICEKKYDFIKKSYKENYSDYRKPLLVSYDYECKVMNGFLKNELDKKEFKVSALNKIFSDFYYDVHMYLNFNKDALYKEDKILNNKILIELIFTIEKINDFYTNNTHYVSSDQSLKKYELSNSKSLEVQNVIKEILSIYKNNYISSKPARAFSSDDELPELISLKTLTEIMLRYPKNYRLSSSDVLKAYYNLYTGLSSLLVKEYTIKNATYVKTITLNK